MYKALRYQDSTGVGGGRTGTKERRKYARGSARCKRSPGTATYAMVEDVCGQPKYGSRVERQGC